MSRSGLSCWEEWHVSCMSIPLSQVDIIPSRLVKGNLHCPLCPEGGSPVMTLDMPRRLVQQLPGRAHKPTPSRVSRYVIATCRPVRGNPLPALPGSVQPSPSPSICSTPQGALLPEQPSCFRHSQNGKRLLS